MIILSGKPGAGKGTQMELLQKRKGYHGISIGQALRDAAQHNQEIAAIQKAGKLVDSATAGRVVEQAIEEAGDTRVILDGFPRNREQAEWLKNYLHRKPPKRLVVVVLDISDKEVARRISRRGRADDTPAILEQRLAVYHTESEHVLDLLKGIADVAVIDGNGTIEEVYTRVERVIEGIEE